MARNVAGGVVRGDDFFGREAEVDALWRKVERGSVLLTGPRRWGKSSLMAALHDAPREGWQVVMLDIEDVYTPSELVVQLTAEVLQCRSVGQRMRELAGSLPGTLSVWIRGVVEEVEVGAENVGSARVRLREALGAPGRWEILAAELISALSRLGDVLVVLDELPVMLSNLLTTDRDAGLRFLRWFRAQRQTGPTNVRFLVGGSVNIEPALERLGQEALLNDLERFHLDPFPSHRAADLVGAVLHGECARAADGVVQAIVAEVETGVPFFIQVVLDECLGRMRADARSMLLLDDVGPAMEATLGPSNRRRFSHYETRLRTHYGPLEEPARAALHLLAATKDGATDAQVEAALRRGGLWDADVDAVLAALEGDYYILRDTRRSRFSHGFLRRWWLRNAADPVCSGRARVSR